jgi:hypothetical protein
MRGKFIQDIERLFEQALAREDLHSALKAKELLGKVCGFLPPTGAQKIRPSAPLFTGESPLEALDDPVLDALLHQLAEKLDPPPS